MNILITGSTGLLGTHLIKSAPNHHNMFGTVHEYQLTLDRPNTTYIPIDIKDKSSVFKAVTASNPDVIIHTAAHGRVDFCEHNQEEAWSTNVDGVKNILDVLSGSATKIIFCSTNMTYDGHNPPYTEDSEQIPETYYGKTKVAAEEAILESESKFTIVRLMTMYGWNWQPNRKNMVSMLIEKLRNKEKLWMTDDVFNNMLFAHEAAKFFWNCVDNPTISDDKKYNIAGSQCQNRYEVTIDACDVFELNSSLVTQVSSDYFEGKEVPRAPNTCFNTRRASTELGFTPISTKAGLKHMRQTEHES